ncbi:CLUMA_CG003494, isoform A [Clunio marinus]|uniref:CLUMA_CG003494, isoform A n=1 Tax=Clunio marinus TaxID=568069 RepID=A0A1J1HQL5_9DIPT|nr:CLUMA_CG003494, isoform A [Clunio marinus]
MCELLCGMIVDVNIHCLNMTNAGLNDERVEEQHRNQLASSHFSPFTEDTSCSYWITKQKNKLKNTSETSQRTSGYLQKCSKAVLPIFIMLDRFQLHEHHLQYETVCLLSSDNESHLDSMSILLQSNELNCDCVFVNQFEHQCQLEY